MEWALSTMRYFKWNFNSIILFIIEQKNLDRRKQKKRLNSTLEMNAKISINTINRTIIVFAWFELNTIQDSCWYIRWKWTMLTYAFTMKNNISQQNPNHSQNSTWNMRKYLVCWCFLYVFFYAMVYVSTFKCLF